MTRSIFDPGGGETERSGSRNLGPAAGNASRMPPDAVDGDVSEAEARDAAPGVADTDGDARISADEAAAQLAAMRPAAADDESPLPADANGDGRVSADEAASALNQMKADDTAGDDAAVRA